MPKPSPSSWAAFQHSASPPSWRWPLWLPSGVLTILAGEAGSGKSALALRLAACFLRGDPWPDGSPYCFEPGAVLWCESESSQALNMQRAAAWGLPAECIFSPFEDPFQNLNLSKVPHFYAFAEKLRLPGLRFVILDSLQGISGGSETSSNTLIILRSLAQLARATSLPILLVHHLRKLPSSASHTRPQLDRLRGTSVIAQTARMVWAIDTPDPLQPAVKRLQVIKSNLAAFPPPLGFTIDSAGLQFVPAPAPPVVVSALDEALALMQNLLASGPLPAAQVQEAFLQVGLSHRLFFSARRLLGVIAARTPTHWILSLPPRP